MTATLEAAVARFLAHKRAIGRKYHSEEAELRLLVRFAREHGADRLADLTPALADDFLASRPRARPRSFNHLRGVVSGLLQWAITNELIETSPLTTRRRRASSGPVPFLFDMAQARRLLNAAGALPDNSRAAHRGQTYRTIFALCYGLGLRAGEACGLRLGDVDPDRQLLVVRGGKFGKSRLVPHGPRIGELVTQQVRRRRAGGAGEDAAAPLFTFNGRTPGQPVHRQPGLPPPDPGSRPDHPRWGRPAAVAQPEALVCSCVPAALVPGRRRPGRAAVPAVDLHGSCQPGLHRCLPDHHR
jgi:integrase